VEKRLLSWPPSRALGASLALLVALSAGSSPSPGDTGPRRPGLALRRAVAALESGAPREAAWRLAATAEEHPLIADIADRLRVQALQDDGRPGEAAAAGLAFLRRYPGSGQRPQVLRALGDAYRALGDMRSARSTWLQALRETRDPSARAGLHAAMAGSFEEDGQPDRAAQEWLEIWSRIPDAPEASLAEAALDRLEAQRERRYRRAASWGRRSEALYDLRHNEAALEACQRALALGPSAAEHREVARRQAYLLFRLRRYPEAAKAFSALGRGKEFRFWHARSLARAGRVEQAIALFKTLARNPRHSLDARALFLAATLEEERAPKGAAKQEEIVARRAPQPSLRREARWRLGWRAWKEGRFQVASAEFEGLVREEADPLAALRPRYWWARSQMAEGDAAGAQALREMARDYPFSYYGWRASQRVARMAPTEREPAPTRQGGEKPKGRSRASKLAPRDLARVRALVEAGLLEDAQQAIRALTRGRRGADLVTLARLYQATGAYHAAERLVIDPNLMRLAAGPRPRQEELWWLAWPDAYAQQVEAAAAQHGVEAALVYAVMREESGYRPDILSVVGARGLTQIMPGTGARLARQLGRDGFHPDQLFDPAVNLELGAFYLAQLMRRFDGRASAAIASYNAGPAVVTRWLQAGSDLGDDAWVEAIPYAQTREYARRVLRSLHIYRTLYGAP